MPFIAKGLHCRWEICIEISWLQLLIPEKLGITKMSVQMTTKMLKLLPIINEKKINFILPSGHPKSFQYAHYVPMPFLVKHNENIIS